MDDVLYLGLTALFFLAALLLIKGADRLWAPRTWSDSLRASWSSATWSPPFSSRSVS